MVNDEPFNVSVNPLNPAGLSVVEKNLTGTSYQLCNLCSVSCRPLINIENLYFTDSNGLSYSDIHNIPCLLAKSSAIAKYFYFSNKY